MPATIDHPAFVQPRDLSTRIWRYMDFAKLVALLETRTLHFPRIDQLHDPFEGSLSRWEYEYWKDLAAKGETGEDLPEPWRGKYFDVLLANARRSRRSIYVNCWHMSGGESEAMWQLYAPSGYGVALQSTYARLVDVLPEKLHNGCFVGMVRYLDHHTERMPDGNAFYAVTHKRRAFEHEKEVRAVVWYGDRGPDDDPDQAANPLGLSVPVALDALIESIFISPAAPTWFADAVKAVVGRYGFGFVAEQSELARPPYL